MAAAAADLAERTTSRAGAERPRAALRADAIPDRRERTLRAERTRTSRFDWALRIAAVIAIVAVGAWGLASSAS